jgi:hypothetical protein
LPLAVATCLHTVSGVDFGVWAFACLFGDERKVRTPQGRIPRESGGA